MSHWSETLGDNTNNSRSHSRHFSPEVSSFPTIFFGGNLISTFRCESPDGGTCGLRTTAACQVDRITGWDRE